MTTTQEAGRKGAEARNEKYSPEERSEISRKAAETRKAENPDAFRQMGAQSHKNDQSGSAGKNNPSQKNGKDKQRQR